MNNTRLPKYTLPLLSAALSLGLVVGGMQLVPQVLAQVSIQPAPAVSSPTSAALEAEAVSLTAIPPRLGEDGSLTIKPGEKKQVQVRVRNSSKQSLNIDTLVQDFVLGEDGQTPVKVTDTVSNRWSLAKWITLSPSTQVLAPNQLGIVNVLIEAPADALPGGHYAMVVHKPTVGKAGRPDAATSAVTQQVGSLLYLTVEGPINEEAFIRNFSLPQLSEFGPVPFSFTVDNASDVHIRPQITVEISNLFGVRVESIQLEPKNVFPLMSRDFDGKWNRIWGMGYYRAKTIMSYGTSGQVVMAQTGFWLLPYRLLMAAGTLILVLLALIIVIRRHWLHRIAQSEAELKVIEEKLKNLEQQTASTTNSTTKE